MTQIAKKFCFILSLAGVIGIVGNTTLKAEPLTRDNYLNYLKSTSQDDQYRGYVKFSIVLDQKNPDDAFKELIFHPASYDYHADHLTTLPEFSGLNPEQIDKFY